MRVLPAKLALESGTAGVSIDRPPGSLLFVDDGANASIMLTFDRFCRVLRPRFGSRRTPQQTPWFKMVTILSGSLLACYAIGVFLLFCRLIRTLTLLRDQKELGATQAAERDWPTLDIVIPVKDEESHIAACLKSILAQDYPNKRIIVVNDRSTDGTAAAIERLQRDHPELHRIDITSLPEGQYGKPSAVAAAMPELRGEFVAFIDSDFELHPHCLRTLVDHLASKKLAWLAVMGKPELTMFWERLLVPLLGAVTYAWYDPRKIADPTWDNAIGSGFIVVRRESYLAIDGHRSVVRAYDEDSEIMRIAKRAGHRIAYVLAPSLFTLRMYGTLERTIRGINRTFIGGLKTLPRFLVTINGLNFVSLLPIGLLIALLFAAQYGVAVPFGTWWTGLAIAHLVASTLLAIIVYSSAGMGKGLALLHPLGAAMLIGICVRAAGELKRGKPITWRGTSY